MVVAFDRILFSFLRLNNTPFYVHTRVCLYTYPWMNYGEYAAMNIAVQIAVSLRDPTFNLFEYILRNGITGSYGCTIF